MERRPWSDEEWRQRFRYLRARHFTPEESADIAFWFHPLDHWVIQNMIEDRRKLIRNWFAQGIRGINITRRLDRRYVDLGIRGQYEQEEWYYSRAGA